MSCWHKHVAKNNETAKKPEICAEIAQLQDGHGRGEMMTNIPHHCVQQPQNRGG